MFRLVFATRKFDFGAKVIFVSVCDISELVTMISSTVFRVTTSGWIEIISNQPKTRQFLRSITLSPQFDVVIPNPITTFSCPISVSNIHI